MMEGSSRCFSCRQGTMYLVSLPRGPDVAALLRSCAPVAQLSGGGPKRLRVLLEGESLLNDASGLTLFEVFFHIVSNPACLLWAVGDCASSIALDITTHATCSCS
jgi:hypothetical protein